MKKKVFFSEIWKVFQRTGAENETRTRDPDLGKVVLYQLSYFRGFFFLKKRMQKYKLFPNQKFFFTFSSRFFLSR